MKSRSLGEPLALLQLALALFFGITGLVYLLNYNSMGAEIGRMFGKLFGKNQTLILITAIIQLISGIILLVGLFAPIDTKYMFIAALAILILWGVQIVMTHFMNNFMKPDFLPWLQKLSLDIIILAGIWGVSTRYSS